MSKNLYRVANLRGFDNKTDEKRLKFCIISRNNSCERFDWEIGRYIETLDVNGAIYDDLKTMFKDHIISVDNAIARVENIRLEDGELLCECVFDESSTTIYERFKNGILNDVSIGYRVIESKISKKDNKNYVLVTKFEILELSAVWKGADKGANLRNKNDIEKIQRAKEYMDLQKEILNLKEKTLWN